MLEIKPDFGDLIRMIRKNKGLTLAKIAESSGISHPYLSQLENGRRCAKNPSGDVIRKIATALEVNPVDLLIHIGYLEESEVKQWQKQSDSSNWN